MNINPKFKIQHSKLIEKFELEINRNLDLPFVKHHTEQYKGNFPLWVAVELFTLGNISQFFSQLKTEDKKIIAKSVSYITKINCTHFQLTSCLRCITDLRNKCAHFARTYNTTFSATPNLPNSQAKELLLEEINTFIYIRIFLF